LLPHLKDSFMPRRSEAAVGLALPAGLSVVADDPTSTNRPVHTTGALSSEPTAR